MAQENLVEAVESSNRKSIGKLLLQSGKVRPEDIDRILREQRLKGLRFGDAAISLGLINKMDIHEALSHQFDYPYLPDASEKVMPQVVCAFQSHSQDVEYFRSVRGQMSLRWLSENKSIVITPTKKGNGCSFISSNLAVSFAQLGEKVLLIDADMREPAQKELFKLRGNAGFSDILAGRAGYECIQEYKPIKNLSILPAGTLPPNPVELIGRKEFVSLVNYAEENYDVVIFDAPAFKEHCDAHFMISVVKGAALVVRKDKTGLKEISEVKNELAVSQAVLVGTIMNDY